MAIWVIGDLQGCYGRFAKLLEKINFDPAADRLWLTGDLVNRGGESLQTLRLVHSLRDSLVTVLGNHDLHLLAEDHNYPDGNSPHPEFAAILNAAERREMLDWLISRPLLHQDKGNKHLLVHAGLLPEWKVREALWAADEIEAMLRERPGKYFRKVYGRSALDTRNHLGIWRRLRLATAVFTRMRFCNSEGRLDLKSSGPPGSQRPGFQPWFEIPHRRKPKWTVIFGHWAALGVYQGHGVIGLDSGCVWGGKLTAMRLEDRQLVSVNCRKYH